jgi:hypothetical protein
MKVFSNFPRDNVKRTCGHFQLRLKEAVTAECDFTR